MTRPILAIDPGLATGWALSTGRVGTKRLLQASDLGGRVWLWEQWFLDMLTQHNPREVSIEKPFLGIRALNTLPIIFHGIAMGMCHAREIPVREFAPSQLKKAVTGSGRAQKGDVLRAVRRAGWLPQDDHQGDAAALIEACRADARSLAA